MTEPKSAEALAAWRRRKLKQERDRRYYQANREKISQRRRERYAKDKQLIEELERANAENQTPPDGGSD